MHEAAVRAFVRRLVPSRADADDIMQDVSTVLWEKFSEFRKDGDFKAWAFGIARFQVLAWKRDKARDRLILKDDVVELLATESAEAEGRFTSQRDALETCLEKVPAKERNLLARAYQPGAKIREVAADSGRSIGGFYQWLHRIRQSLLDCVTSELAVEGNQ